MPQRSRHSQKRRRMVTSPGSTTPPGRGGILSGSTGRGGAEGTHPDEELLRDVHSVRADRLSDPETPRWAEERVGELGQRGQPAEVHDRRRVEDQVADVVAARDQGTDERMRRAGEV